MERTLKSWSAISRKWVQFFMDCVMMAAAQTDEHGVACGGDHHHLLAEEPVVVRVGFPVRGERGKHVIEPAGLMSEREHDLFRYVVLLGDCIEERYVRKEPLFAGCLLGQLHQFFSDRECLAAELPGDGNGRFQRSTRSKETWHGR